MNVLHDAPSEAYARLVRCATFGIWVVTFALIPLERIAALPPSLFAPPGLLGKLPQGIAHILISETGLVALRVLGAVACAICLSARGARWIGLPACALIFVHESVVRGFGHTNHAEIPALLAALFCAVGALTDSRGRRPEPLAIALVLALTYTLTAAHRLAYGGIALFLSDSIVYWSADRAGFVDTFHLGLGAHALTQPWFAKLLQLSFPVITLCELLMPLALVSRPLRLIVVPSVLAFHVGVLVIMNILFWQNVVLLVVLFLVPHRSEHSKK